MAVALGFAKHVMKINAVCQVVLEVESMAADKAGTPELDEVQTILGRVGFTNITVDEPQKGSRVFNVYARRSKDNLC